MGPRATSPLMGVMRLGLLEWQRTRWPLLLVLCVAAGGGLGLFAASLAVTESTEIRLTVQAATTRFFLVVAFTLLIIVNTVRDQNDGLLDFALSRPVARWQWWLGKFLSCVLAAFLSAIAAGILLLAGSTPLAAAAWAASLGSELVIMAAAALTFALGLRQVTPAFIVAMGFYVLCRSLQGLVMLSRDALLDTGTLLQAALASGIRTIALILPDLARYARSEWLVGHPPSTDDLQFILLQTALGAAVLALLGIIDFSRRRR